MPDSSTLLTASATRASFIHKGPVEAQSNCRSKAAKLLTSRLHLTMIKNLYLCLWRSAMRCL